MNPPTEHMKARPEGEEYLLPAFIAAARFASGRDSVRLAFEKAHPEARDLPVSQSAALYLDWFAEEVWGVEKPKVES